jgi:hypothetical protein
VSCKYRFLVGRHGLDLLALSQRQTHSVVVVTGCTQAQRAWLGADGPSRISADDVTTWKQPGNDQAEFVFADGQAFGEILERVRGRWPGQQVCVLVAYDRLQQDLPPLTADDEIQCFWDVREQLQVDHFDYFKYLSQRTQLEECRFAPVCLYIRGNDSQGQYAELVREISAKSALPISNELVAGVQ